MCCQSGLLSHSTQTGEDSWHPQCPWLARPDTAYAEDTVQGTLRHYQTARFYFHNLVSATCHNCSHSSVGYFLQDIKQHGAVFAHLWMTTRCFEGNIDQKIQKAALHLISSQCNCKLRISAGLTGVVLVNKTALQQCLCQQSLVTPTPGHHRL